MQPHPPIFMAQIYLEIIMISKHYTSFENSYSKRKFYVFYFYFGKQY